MPPTLPIINILPPRQKPAEFAQVGNVPAGETPECGSSSVGPPFFFCSLVMPHQTCRAQVSLDGCAHELEQEATNSFAWQMRQGTGTWRDLCHIIVAMLHQVCTPWAVLCCPLAAVRQVMLLKTRSTGTFQPRRRK